MKDGDCRALGARQFWLGARVGVVSFLAVARIKADLVLEKRSLLDWLLEPLLAAKRRQE